eukprot:jgi/Orpsp1_1/1185714/evm.model.c7180000094924.1
MKSILFALIVVFIGYVYADCPEATLLTMTDCVKIRKEARDSFCITKQAELAKCNCVYDTYINSCYEYCPDEPSVQTEKQQFEADFAAQCAAANLNPKEIPADVYNEMKADAMITSTNTATSSATPNASNNNNQASDGLTKDDYADSAQSIKFYSGLMLVNAILALILFV